MQWKKLRMQISGIHINLQTGHVVLSHHSQNHNILEAERDLWSSSGPTPCSGSVNQNQLPRTMSRWLLNVSRDGDFTASLFQCLVILTVKKCLL